MNNNRIKKIMIGTAVIAAIVIIPLLYSYLYLGAFWDPYSRLETLPVAVVNNDQGAVINGEQRNVGQEMCDKLEDEADLKFIFTDEATAKAGTEGSDYYAMVVIPEDFSSSIASASTTDKHTATIQFSANEKRNYLASQILSRAVLQIEETVRDDVNSEIVAHLADTIKEVPDQMTELQDGLNKLSDGSSDLKDGSAALAEGTHEFQDKMAEYQNGVSKLTDGSTALVTGSASLNDGIDKLLTGADQLTASTEDIGKLSEGAKQLATGASALNTGLQQYIAGVDTLIDSVNTTSEFLKNYVTKVNPAIMKDQTFAGFVMKLSDTKNTESIAALKSASTKLKTASQQIADGTATLSAGTKSLPELKTALKQLSQGLSDAKAGSEQLAQGSKALSEGLGSVKEATAKLTDAAAELSEGADQLDSGVGELKDGITTAQSGVDTAITDTDDQLEALEGLKEYSKAPVTVEQDNIVSVPNYGTAFAPYFLSLSLWVGALIMFVGIYLDTEGKFKILSSNSEHKVARSFIYLLIGFAQALVLAKALEWGLGLKVENEGLYIAACCLYSMVAISIVQFLMVHLKDLGKFLSIVLLIIQLTSCGGTFPMETVPKFFNYMYPYMPMTYSVGLMKEAISGANSSNVIHNAVILIIILVVFMAMTILLSVLKAKKAAKALEKEYPYQTKEA
jgi:putative membrane protein